MVATIAFGMGIDQAAVRFVLHMGLPRTLEMYGEATGRAGRDGKASECVLLFDPTDVIRQTQLSKVGSDVAKHPLLVWRDLRELGTIARYCQDTDTCRRVQLASFYKDQQSSDKGTRSKSPPTSTSYLDSYIPCLKSYTHGDLGIPSGFKLDSLLAVDSKSVHYSMTSSGSKVRLELCDNCCRLLENTVKRVPREALDMFLSRRSVLSRCLRNSEIDIDHDIDAAVSFLLEKVTQTSTSTSDHAKKILSIITALNTTVTKLLVSKPWMKPRNRWVTMQSDLHINPFVGCKVTVDVTHHIQRLASITLGYLQGSWVGEQGLTLGLINSIYRGDESNARRAIQNRLDKIPDPVITTATQSDTMALTSATRFNDSSVDYDANPLLSTFNPSSAVDSFMTDMRELPYFSSGSSLSSDYVRWIVIQALLAGVLAYHPETSSGMLSAADAVRPENGEGGDGKGGFAQPLSLILGPNALVAMKGCVGVGEDGDDDDGDDDDTSRPNSFVVHTSLDSISFRDHFIQHIIGTRDTDDIEEGAGGEAVYHCLFAPCRSQAAKHTTYADQVIEVELEAIEQHLESDMATPLEYSSLELPPPPQSITRYACWLTAKQIMDKGWTGPLAVTAALEDINISVDSLHDMSDNTSHLLFSHGTIPATNTTAINEEATGEWTVRSVHAVTSSVSHIRRPSPPNWVYLLSYRGYSWEGGRWMRGKDIASSLLRTFDSSVMEIAGVPLAGLLWALQLDTDRRDHLAATLHMYLTRVGVDQRHTVIRPGMHILDADDEDVLLGVGGCTIAQAIVCCRLVSAAVPSPLLRCPEPLSRWHQLGLLPGRPRVVVGFAAPNRPTVILLDAAPPDGLVAAARAAVDADGAVLDGDGIGMLLSSPVLPNSRSVAQTRTPSKVTSCAPTPTARHSTPGGGLL
eukprot:gnl/Dysnectes_brevis/7422_a12410_240.p1 GENE.gnl/Dysnectes_brevis/7422_a12410_240~~gnl/Dysnectes_brevis/7422_a12410_240.p1  ORF type:complete len:915 (+),score=173.09 gnl/Dysnectes_brevis/7422_a12410_240:244-2988(+)